MTSTLLAMLNGDSIHVALLLNRNEQRTMERGLEARRHLVSGFHWRDFHPVLGMIKRPVGWLRQSLFLHILSYV